MRARGPGRLTTALLVLVAAAVGAPGAGQPSASAGAPTTSAPSGEAGPDLSLEYVGWDPNVPTLIRFKVTNAGDVASEKTTGKGETLSPPPAQETAPPIPALEPGATFDIAYAVWPADDCDNHRVRMSVPLEDDTDPTDNTLEVQLCDTDAGTDLKLEYLGVVPRNPRFIAFKVTNVGPVGTDATTGRAEALTPPAPVASPPIPALDPGASYEFQYELAEPACRGTLVEVVASVPLAGDRYPINNDRYIQVCKPLPITPVPERQPDPVGPAPKVLPPEHLRPGRHPDVEFGATQVKVTRAQQPLTGNCPANAVEPRERTVGFQNTAAPNNSCIWRQYYRLLFSFDLSKLRGHELTPVDARLDYMENAHLRRTPDGGRPNDGPLLFASCGLQLGRPVPDWYKYDGAYRYELLKRDGPIGTFAGLKDAVMRMIADPAAEEQGLVLVGPNEAMSLDKAACLSQVSNITLSFTYDIK